MKATDLMIGDWVQVMDAATGTPYNCRVRYTIWPSMENALIGLDNKEISVSSLPAECLFPIPITPEILEKNGFRWTGSGDRTMMCGTPYDFEGIRYNIYVGLKNKCIEVHAAMTEMHDERWRKVNKLYLEVCGCYVHELQHALKLCGIDKEILL